MRRLREGSKIKRIKFIERRGRSLQDLLVSGNPWSDQKCGRTKCMICQRETGNMGECMRENALYKIRKKTTPYGNIHGINMEEKTTPPCSK